MRKRTPGGDRSREAAPWNGVGALEDVSGLVFGQMRLCEVYSLLWEVVGLRRQLGVVIAFVARGE
jgi:hypothetical protein